MLAALPRQYDAALREELEHTLWRCFDDSRESAYAAHACFPAPFGHDVRTGRPLQVFLNCTGICPAETKLGSEFVEHFGRRECACIGGEPVHSGGCFGTPSGCGPSASNAQASTIVPIMERGEQRYMIADPVRPFPKQWLFTGAIKAVDGKRISDPEALSQLASAFPNERPRSVTWWWPRRRHGPRAGESTLYFVPRSVIQDLAKLRDTLLVFAPGSSLRCDRARQVESGIAFDRKDVFYQRACPGEPFARLRKLDEIIRRAARFAEARKAAPPLPRDVCKGLDQQPISVSTWGEHERVELIYLDWAAR